LLKLHSDKSGYNEFFNGLENVKTVKMMHADTLHANQAAASMYYDETGRAKNFTRFM
jgi:hypothetical protein